MNIWSDRIVVRESRSADGNKTQLGLHPSSEMNSKCKGMRRLF